MLTAFNKLDDGMTTLAPIFETFFTSITSLVDQGMAYDLIDKNVDKELLIQKFFLIFDAIELYAAFNFPFRLEDIMLDFISSIF